MNESLYIEKPVEQNSLLLETVEMYNNIALLYLQDIDELKSTESTIISLDNVSKDVEIVLTLKMQEYLERIKRLDYRHAPELTFKNGINKFNLYKAAALGILLNTGELNAFRFSKVLYELNLCETSQDLYYFNQSVGVIEDYIIRGREVILKNKN